MYKLSPFSYSFSSGGQGKKIFLDREIALFPNEFITITGPSGGGKSTLLKILKGIIPQYSSGVLQGEITFHGKPLTGENFEENLKKILYLFQNPFSQLIYPTTEEEFLFSMENFNFTRPQMMEQKEKFEKLFSLNQVWGKKTNQLSNGECQKLVLASMLAIGPEVILLDEPTAFLDPESRREFYQFLEKIKGDRLIIIVDHHLEEMKHLANRFIHVDQDGKISEVIRPSSVKKSAELTLPEMSAPSELKISLQDVSFSYDKHPLLKNMTAEFGRGDVIAIKGMNGAGKSTLFKLLAGVLKPSAGKIITTINGKKFLNQKNFSNVGFIFQNPESHFFYDTIEEELAQSFKGIPDSLRAELIKKFFFDIDLKKSPFLLSEGEKRRLSILMTVFLEKNILLYDEPTFGQDQESVERIKALILELKRFGFIQVIISHDEEIISETADKVFILKEGGLHEVS